MYLPNEQSKLFCLECVPDLETEKDSNIFPFLEQLVKKYAVVNVYKAVDSIEAFEESLNILLYEDRNFKDYHLIYFICEGSKNEIVVNGYTYTLEKIAELFEGKLNGKVLHFANTKSLNIDTETSQYFIDVTGAKAISGYKKTKPMHSALLDMHFFGLYPEFNDVTELVENLFEKHYALCTHLNFHLYY